MKRIGGILGRAEPVVKGRRPASAVKELGTWSRRSPGVAEGDMSRRSRQRKLGPTRGRPRRSRTAEAFRITGRTGKSERACEWLGWGRLGVDGRGHYNPTGARTCPFLIGPEVIRPSALRMGPERLHGVGTPVHEELLVIFDNLPRRYDVRCPQLRTSLRRVLVPPFDF